MITFGAPHLLHNLGRVRVNNCKMRLVELGEVGWADQRFLEGGSSFGESFGCLFAKVEDDPVGDLAG